MNLTELSKLIRSNNAAKEFESPSVDIHRKLLLAVSEICEAQEELRDGRDPREILYDPEPLEFHPHMLRKSYFKGAKPIGFSVEIADAIIRLLDICAAYDIDINRVLHEKLEYNKTRPPKHGRRF